MGKLPLILGAGALVALAFAGVAKANPSPSPSGGITISGQPYFNGLNPSSQQRVLSLLYSWYQGAKGNGQWPNFIEDPGVTSQGQMTDPGNFGIIVDAYDAANGLTAAAAGVLDVAAAKKMGAV